MPRITHWPLQIPKAKFFVGGHCFLQFRHGLDIDLTVTELLGKGQGIPER